MSILDKLFGRKPDRPAPPVTKAPAAQAVTSAIWRCVNFDENRWIRPLFPHDDSGRAPESSSRIMRAGQHGLPRLWKGTWPLDDSMTT